MDWQAVFLFSLMDHEKAVLLNIWNQQKPQVVCTNQDSLKNNLLKLMEDVELQKDFIIKLSL